MPLARCCPALLLSYHAGLFQHGQNELGCSLNVLEVGAPMDFSQSPLHDQRPKDDVVPLVPAPMAVKAWPGAPTHDADDQYISTTMSPQLIDVTAEETCPAVQTSAQDGVLQLAPAIQTAQAPSAITFELMSKLEALASDLAVKGRASSDQCIGNVHEESKLSSGLRTLEPSIRVSPRPCGLNDQFASDKPSIGRRTFRRVARFFITALIAALIGVAATFVWQFSTAKSPNDVAVAEKQSGFTPVGQASLQDAPPQPTSVTQTTPAPTAPASSSPARWALSSFFARVKRSFWEPLYAEFLNT